jgi:hypothetical protein
MLTAMTDRDTILIVPLPVPRTTRPKPLTLSNRRTIGRGGDGRQKRTDQTQSDLYHKKPVLSAEVQIEGIDASWIRRFRNYLATVASRSGRFTGDSRQDQRH